jgi:DNA-binding response OmpR family regulator
MAEPAPTRRKRILYAEDDPDSGEVLCALFNEYEVSTATTISQAWEIARSGRFDLYLLGLGFEGGWGIELCRQLRASDPAAPIVFLSSESSQSFISSALAAGATAYIAKPFDADSLVSTTEQLLNRRCWQTTGVTRQI